MKKLLMLMVFAIVSMIPVAPVEAGNGSEACVTACSDGAEEACGSDSKCYSAYFNGCMLTCWM